jgi:hypothetical protein
MNKRVLARLALAGWLAGTACGENPAIAIIPVRLELTPATDTVYVGEIATRLTAHVFNAHDEEIPDADVAWSGDAPLVALVDSLTGAVTGVLPGTARVSARVGSVADTAAVIVLDLIRLTLPYDTLVLAPGDTFTVPVEMAVAPGTPTPLIRFGGGAPGIATIDTLTGLVTAVADGAAAYVVQAGSTVAGGLLAVVAISDTLSGVLHLGLSGAVSASATLSARAFNHPTLDLGTLFQIHALDDIHDLSVLLVDSLTGPGTRVVQTVAPNGLGSDPVCFPPGSFVFYRRTLLSALTALSQAGGTVSVTSDQPIQGGRAISGRMDVTMQRTDVAGPEGRIRARASFALALVSLSSCPQ